MAVVVGLVVVLLLRVFVLQVFRIPSESMEPTLLTGDRVIAVTWGVRGSVPSIGDVMIFDSPIYDTEGGERYLVKRVVGQPGDVLAFADGRVERNGALVDEPWVMPGSATENLGHGHDCTAEAPCTVLPDTVWMLGDNRALSEDSRWFGAVPTDALVGRAVVRVWPPSRLGGV